MEEYENESDIPVLGSWNKIPRDWNSYLGITFTDQVEELDPEEFWKDEPDKADGYANVYIPFDDFYTPAGPCGYLIKSDVEEYFNDHAGPRRCYSLDWYQNTMDYDWYVRGQLYRNDKKLVQVCIRDLKMAMLIKLTFGGK